MREIEVTMEISYRMAKTFRVTEEQYKEVKAGALPDEILNDIEEDILDNPDDCDKETYWAVVDDETGEMLQEWG